jgi:hypothetical protein
MQAWFGEWALVISVALLSGVFNLIVAYYKFDREIRSPFFNPKISFGFWLWIFLQLAIPAIIFWLLYGATIETIPKSENNVTTITHKITPDLITKAITVGMGFTAFVNANLDLGFAGVPLDKFYFGLTQLTYQLIAAKENQKLASFTTDLEQELIQPTIQIPAGLNYLKNYFQRDFALKRNPVEQQALLDRITQARTDPQVIPSLILSVRRRDTLETLKRFGCQPKFLDIYFP